jgi:diadenosine tetraphosphate (Ap4A) HIT family hydrolase
MNDATYPWLLLIPKRNNMAEIIDLPPEEQMLLMQEIASISTLWQTMHTPEKLNVAALGNMVKQLHVHIIARFTTDAAWPNPVWGKVQAKPYMPAQAQTLIEKLQASHP